MDQGDSAGKDWARLPPLDVLSNFEAVARHGSFAVAAEVLHIAHWAVGKQIRNREAWFGVPQFERRVRGVVLTDDGAALRSRRAKVTDRANTDRSLVA